MNTFSLLSLHRSTCTSLLHPHPRWHPVTFFCNIPFLSPQNFLSYSPPRSPRTSPSRPPRGPRVLLPTQECRPERRAGGNKGATHSSPHALATCTPLLLIRFVSRRARYPFVPLPSPAPSSLGHFPSACLIPSSPTHFLIPFSA